MDNLIVTGFICYGIWWVLNYSPLTKRFREEFNINKKNEHWFAKLYGCVFCATYWMGVIGLLWMGLQLNSFVFAFAVAVISYFLHLVEEKLIK